MSMIVVKNAVTGSLLCVDWIGIKIDFKNALYFLSIKMFSKDSNLNCKFCSLNMYLVFSMMYDYYGSFLFERLCNCGVYVYFWSTNQKLVYQFFYMIII